MELTISGKIVLIDDEDYEKVSQYNWNITKNGYVIHGVKPRLYLHQFLVGKIEGLVIDHINQNKLDNRKENLRHVTEHINNQNVKSNGYWFDKSRKKWAVRIERFGKRHYLGRYNTEEEAKEVARKFKEEV